MESISPITLRKALDALALPARAIQPRRELHTARTTGAAAWKGLGVTLLAAALGVAWAISVWR